jgi:hypothetical protein
VTDFEHNKVPDAEDNGLRPNDPILMQAAEKLRKPLARARLGMMPPIPNALPSRGGKRALFEIGFSASPRQLPLGSR